MHTPDDYSGGTPAAVRIQEHAVGVGSPVFIVAEARVNHNGCEITALRLVDVGADLPAT